MVVIVYRLPALGLPAAREFVQVSWASQSDPVESFRH
jgi:hypothetical protein